MEEHDGYHYRLPIAQPLDGRMVKSLMQSELRMSRRLLRQLVRNDCVRCNGVPVHLTYRVHAGDVLSISLPKEQSDVAPEEMALDICYEDDEIIIINKCAGILTHPSAREKTGSLLAGLRSYLLPQGAVPHAVHRLDRDTSGLVMFAKHAHAHHLFDIALRNGQVHRTYVALAHDPAQAEHKIAAASPEGHNEDWQTIDLPIALDPNKPSRRVISADGQRAVTHYRILARAGAYLFLQIVLETGRTHQIRLHLAAMGMPLVGDSDYNVWFSANSVNSGGPPNSSAVMSRQALHAIQLGWKHPVLEQIHIVRANPSEDMQDFWSSVGGNSDIWKEVAEDVSGFRQVNLGLKIPAAIQAKVTPNGEA